MTKNIIEKTDYKKQIEDMINKYPVIVCEYTDNEVYFYSDYKGSNSIRVPHETDIYTQIERWHLENGEKTFEIEKEALTDIIN